MNKLADNTVFAVSVQLVETPPSHIQIRLADREARSVHNIIVLGIYRHILAAHGIEREM